ncbi:MAG: hypothetical protein ACKV2Q_19630 [Planctomycetaceae bacterium]
MRRHPTTSRCLIGILTLLLTVPVGAADDFPPGWLLIARLEGQPTWREVRDDQEHVHLYLPNGDKPVRGVFVCFVFHSGDPRELADLWNFALVTVPWPFEFDLGHNDKRNGRFKLGHAAQNMGLLLRYLDHAAKETRHPELATVPLVGWLGQNGSHLCADLHQRAPERVLAWSDSFPNRLRQHPELTQRVPFAFAWEIPKNELRAGQRVYRNDADAPADLSCRATTYGFDHGIYSKFNFFMAFLDRCIAARLPAEMPPPGQPVKLNPVVREQGWVGDFDPVSGWNPITPAGTERLADAKYPVWFPDEYAAWSWRAYHSACTDLEITGPKLTYQKRDNKWGGPDCGLGYGGPLKAGDQHTFSAKVSGDYARVEYHDGHRIVGASDAAPWTVAGVTLEPGLRVLFAAGVKADGTRAASRPAFVIVK